MGEGRGTSNSPNTRNPERSASKPGRLDQFADDVFEFGGEFDMDNRKDIKLPETRKDDDESARETGKRSG